jgi:hypothetical protein
MPEIRNVNVRIDSIREIGIPPVRSVFTGLPEPIVKDVPVPVTVTIGTPIVNVPGCVEVNLDDAINDPNGNVTFCDGDVPSFNPPDYDPNQMTLTGPPEPLAEAPKLDLEPPKTPELPKTPIKTPQPTVPIVTAEEEKEEAIEIVEEPTFVEQYLPSAEEVTTTVTIAVAAATAAVFGKPLAELLLKLIKPAVKKVIKKLKDKVGSTEEVLSVSERRQLQRDLRK